MLVLLAVPSLCRAQINTWKPIANFGKPVGCGYFCDEDHGLIGTGVRAITYDDADEKRISQPGSPISIYKTSDGGSTWDTAIVPSRTGAVTAISMQDSLLGYAAIFSDASFDAIYT